MYKIIIKPSVVKFSERLTTDQRGKIKKTLLILSESPYQNSLNIKKLTGTSRLYFRIRIGDLRIIYELDNLQKIITVHDLGFRGNIY